jgi:hypothetical protein
MLRFELKLFDNENVLLSFTRSRESGVLGVSISEGFAWVFVPTDTAVQREILAESATRLRGDILTAIIETDNVSYSSRVSFLCNFILHALQYECLISVPLRWDKRTINTSTQLYVTGVVGRRDSLKSF